MPPRSIRDPEVDRRSQPRALVRATLVVLPENRPASEHMIYDLSTGGARLCGIPHAEVGARMRVALCLPRATLRASAWLLRTESAEPDAEFAIEFCRLRARVEDAIQDAIVEALSSAEERAVLLLQGDRGSAWAGWRWLDPVSAICLAAANPAQAFEYLDRYGIKLGLASDPQAMGPPASRWAWAFPEVSWRTIDSAGRLQRVG